ncbi:hypothetical protein PRIPAC_91454 [Pristionchus pacificus]|uniref:Fatty-acid and retinol-binding protein 1 n=1 Tax=Pristionchus pacificus TaxID=54126 RepID=A0A454XLP2_PRIPA|nr:hypothetical protein PRIPAC_91454 [Pristionchus pacificus]|eukprot:PDM77332.1 hypothetical protein PRIPAC_35532 [Pristionchus pacificus]
MRSLICLSALLVSAYCAPVLTDRQQKIKQIWGEDTNVTRAETILAEEAKKLGISFDDYFNSCTADAETLMFTKQEEADMKQEMEAAAKMGNVKVKTWDELFEVLKVRAPKTYAALMKRREVWNKTIAKLDAPAQSFVKNLGNTFLDSVNGLSESEVAGKNPLEIFSMLGKNVKKTKSEYEALPQESKNSLERHFRVRSSIRIVDEYGILRIAFSVIGIVSDL